MLLDGRAKTHWQEYKMKTNLLFEGQEKHLDVTIPLVEHDTGLCFLMDYWTDYKVLK